MQKWEESTHTTNRLTWIRCYNVSLFVWNTNCLSSLISDFGKVQDIDEDSLSLKGVKFMRVLVMTSTQQTISKNFKITINGLITLVKLVEEMKVFKNHCCCKEDRIRNEEDAYNQDSEMGMRLGSLGSKCSFDAWHASKHDVIQRQDCRQAKEDNMVQNSLDNNRWSKSTNDNTHDESTNARPQKEEE